MSEMSRRSFVAATAASAALALPPSRIWAQPAIQGDTPWLGEKIIDCHFHSRPTNEAILAHLNGAGVSSALVLANDDFSSRFRELEASNPGRVPGWTRSTRLRADDPHLELPVPVQPGESVIAGVSAIDAIATLRNAVAAGAKGFSETSGLVYADGPELQRLYALAAELDVPIMMHFQQMAVPGHPRYGISGFSRLEAMLKRYPRTRFICHASDFWGHIDADYVDGGAYPTGKVHRGGLVERLLADYPNIYGDCSAPSGLVQLSHDLEFTTGFLSRHRGKLIFGSDCGCSDGRGGSAATPPAPAAQGAVAPGTLAGAPPNMGYRMAMQAGFANKCIARELLTVIWKTTSREIFRDIAWNNGTRVYKLEA